jgi:hypothetical protein
MFASSVIVGDLDVDRPVRALGPLEADPPLVVDADAVLAFAVTAQGLQRVAGQGREVLQARGGFQPVEPFFSLSRETGELLDPLAFGKTLSLASRLAHDHSSRNGDGDALRQA